jgi:hypothetical protein
MECDLCCEKFFIPKTKEEMINFIKKLRTCTDEEGKKKMKLLITPKHNLTHSCSTPNCNYIMCENCWEKINKVDQESSLDDLPCWGEIKCPYCRQTDWKYYMKKYVLDQLQYKVLEPEEYIELLL